MLPTPPVIHVPLISTSPRDALLAAVMMHVEGFYSITSEAFRNKNPGNLEVEGKPGVFRVYPTILQGYEDLLHDIKANHGSKLRDFISKYAPPNENNTSEYLEIVSTRTEIGPDDIL